MKNKKILKTCILSLFFAAACVLPVLDKTAFGAESWLTTNVTATASSYVAPYEPSRACDNDASTATSRWYCDRDGTDKYIVLDLGGVYNITQWKVVGMGAAGFDSSYNLKNYSFSVKTDASANYTAVDNVIGNTQNSTTRTITKTKARYVKLTISYGNQNNNNWASVMEFNVYGGLDTISNSAISGITPVVGQTPVTTIDNTQYTGTITWSPSAQTFAADTQYTATITITPKAGYTLTGVAENFFSATGASSTTNAASTGTVTAVFTKAQSSLVSITAPNSITDVASGTAKTAEALGLPSSVGIVTSGGNKTASVSWDVAGSSYDPSAANLEQQTYTINGTVTLPDDVINPNGVSLSTSIQIVVNGANKTFVSIVIPTPVSNVTNGTTEGALELLLPQKVTILTNGTDQELADVTWNVADSSYNPSDKDSQSFSVSGTITLPAGVVNTNNVSLNTSILVNVNAGDRTLIKITAPNAVANVANGITTDSLLLLLPTGVSLETDDGNVTANVSWNVASSGYDQTDKDEQSFDVDGNVTLPSGVINPNNVSLQTSINVTVVSGNRTLISIVAPNSVTKENGTAKTSAALGLPTGVSLETDDGNVMANVTWDVASSGYDQTDKDEQNFDVDGNIALPSGVINPNNVSLQTSINVTVASGNRTLISIYKPNDIFGITNGTTEGALELLLPAGIMLETDDGNVIADVSWDIASSGYDPADENEQNLNVPGFITLLSGVINPNNVSLETSINVAVDAKPITGKILTGITVPQSITGLANGTAKTAADLGLPSSVTLETDDGNVTASVTWDVASAGYDPADENKQSFDVTGTAALPNGVINPNNVSLETSINVTVNAKAVIPSTDKILTGITAPHSITGLANGTAKTAAALKLPSSVTLETDGGNVTASVTWDVASAGYDKSKTAKQSFTVTGTAVLPEGVINPNNVSLEVNIRVTVNEVADNSSDESSDDTTGGGTTGGGTTGGGTTGGSTTGGSTTGGGTTGGSTTGGGTTGGSTAVTGETKDTVGNGAVVLVDGTSYQAGTVTADTQNGKNEINVTVYEDKLTTSIAENKDKSIVRVNVPAGGDVSSASFTAKTLNEAAKKNNSIELATQAGNIRFDSNMINTENIKKALSDMSVNANDISLSDVILKISISNDAEGSIAENQGSFANVTVNIEASYGKKKINLDSLSAFSKIMIPISTERNAAGNIMGKAVGNGEDTRPVPVSTEIVDGKLFAVINTMNGGTFDISIGVPEDFSDTKGHWAESSIRNLSARKMVSGVGNNLYEPDRDITRAEFTAETISCLGIKKITEGSNFTDVRDTDWFKNYINTAVNYGLVSGRPDGSFGSNEPITRQDAMVIANNVMKLIGAYDSLSEKDIDTVLGVFADGNEAASYAKEAVSRCVVSGIISGRASNRLALNEKITRAESTVMTERLLKALGFINK